MLTVSVLILGVGATGLIAGSRLRSPAEAALETAPPDLGLLTAPVEVRRLGGEVLTRGSLIRVTSRGVHLPGVVGQGKLVTAIARVGDSVVSGDSPVELDGRPMFVLRGSTVLHRDLVGDTVGEDVKAIQQALLDAGLDPGEVDGRYGSLTAAAVEQLYSRAGYPLPLPPINAEEVAAAQAAVEDARDALHLARQQRDDTQASREATVEATQNALDDALAAADQTNELASKRIATALLETGAARAGLEEAQKVLAEAATEEERGLAEEVVEQATIALARAEEAEAAVRAEAEAAMRGVESAIQEATSALDEAKREAHSDDIDLQVASAERALTLTQSRLDSIRLGRLTPFPASEVALVPTFPMVVTAVGAGVGSLAETSALSMAPTVSTVAVVAAPPDVARRLEVETSALIIPDGGSATEGSVTWIASRTGPEPPQARFGRDVVVPEGQVAIEITPSRDLVAGSITAVAAVFALFVTDEAVPIVPVSAIRTDADGSTWVAVLKDDETRRVNVTPGPASDGAASVLGGSLAEGDEVVLGEL